MAVEYNRQLLSTYFKFIPGSKLKLFIEKRVGINPLRTIRKQNNKLIL